MGSNTDWGVPPAGLIIPPYADSDEAAIVIEPDPPGCLASRYDQVIYIRTINSTLGRAQFFIGVVKDSLVPPATGTMWVERGWYFHNTDPSTFPETCSVFVTGRWFTNLDTLSAREYGEAFGNLLQTGTPVPPAPTTDFRMEIDGILFQQGNIQWGALGTPAVTVQDLQIASFGSAAVGYTTVGGALCGAAFVMPPSGKVLIHYGGRMSNNTAGQSTYLSFIWRDGGVVGAGAVLYTGTDDDATDHAGNANQSQRQGVSRMIQYTPGATTNIVLQHRVQGGTGTFSRRYFIAEPVM